MATYRIDAVHKYQTELPRDVSMNTFHVETAGAMTPTQADDVEAAIIGFYNNNQTTNAVSARMSSYINRTTTGSYLVYREVGVEGPGFDFRTFGLGAANSDQSLPFEVAACLSYGSVVAGVDRRRTRGRIYLGPLTNDTETVNYASDSPPLLDPTFVVDLAEAAAELRDALATAGAPWVVYSRAAIEAFPIDGGYVDNAFDTQRRREVDTTFRLAW